MVKKKYKCVHYPLMIIIMIIIMLQSALKTNNNIHAVRQKKHLKKFL